MKPYNETKKAFIKRAIDDLDNAVKLLYASTSDISTIDQDNYSIAEAAVSVTMATAHIQSALKENTK
jgi:hypothetical protein